MSRQSMLLAGLLLVMGLASAQDEVYIKNGFVTGEAYLLLDATSQTRYASGLVDGLLIAPLMGAPASKMAWLQSCVVSMSDSQVAAMLSQELKSNPGSWHQSAHVPMYSALNKACPQSPHNLSPNHTSISQ